MPTYLSHNRGIRHYSAEAITRNALWFAVEEVPYPVMLIIKAGSMVIGRHKHTGNKVDLKGRITAVVIVGKQTDMVMKKWLMTMCDIVCEAEDLQQAADLSARMIKPGEAVLWCNMGEMQLKFKE